MTPRPRVKRTSQLTSTLAMKSTKYNLAATTTINGETLIKVIIFVPIFILAILAILYYQKSLATDQFGQLGDFIGGILNPLIAYLALSSIIIGINSINRQIYDSNANAIQINKKHIEALAQSNAIGLLQAFGEAVRMARRKNQDSLEEAMRSILLRHQSATQEELAPAIASIMFIWGGVMRCVYLLDSMTDNSPFTRSIQESAISSLAVEEIEYLTISAANISLEFAKRIYIPHQSRLSLAIPTAVQKICPNNDI